MNIKEVSSLPSNRFKAARDKLNNLKHSPRTMIIAPPNLPVKDYLFIDT